MPVPDSLERAHVNLLPNLPLEGTSHLKISLALKLFGVRSRKVNKLGSRKNEREAEPDRTQPRPELSPSGSGEWQRRIYTRQMFFRKRREDVGSPVATSLRPAES